MGRSPRAIKAAALGLLAVVLVVAVGGCGGGSALRASEQGSSQTEVATGTTAPTSSASSSAEASGTGSKPQAEPQGGGLSESDAKAIDAELTAIEKELESLTLPSDSDFGGIESGLE